VVRTNLEFALTPDEFVLTRDDFVIQLDEFIFEFDNVGLQLNEVLPNPHDAECVLGLDRLFRLVVGHQYSGVLQSFDGRLFLSHCKSGHDVHTFDCHLQPLLGAFAH
jgi:hypothetical protein